MAYNLEEPSSIFDAANLELYLQDPYINLMKAAFRDRNTSPLSVPGDPLLRHILLNQEKYVRLDNLDYN